jgi:hypothetical protein
LFKARLALTLGQGLDGGVTPPPPKHKNGRALFSPRGEIRLCSQGRKVFVCPEKLWYFRKNVCMSGKKFAIKKAKLKLCMHCLFVKHVR